MYLHFVGIWGGGGLSRSVGPMVRSGKEQGGGDGPKVRSGKYAGQGRIFHQEVKEPP